MSFILDAMIPGRAATRDQLMNAEHAARGGATKAKQLNGYVKVDSYRGGYRVRWRWRHEAGWRHGFVATRDEAETLAMEMRAAIAKGEDPGPLPQYDPRHAREEAAEERTPEEIEAARARIRALMAEDAPRCGRCHMLSPCSPCIPEMRERLRTERRER